MKIITDKYEWNRAISESCKFDFYHTAKYNELYDEGYPQLFVFEHQYEKILLPLLKREIKGTPYFDFTSVYGYVGCLYNTHSPSIELLNTFHDEMKEYAYDNNIISAFSRLHPLIENSNTFPSDLGEVVKLNKTVSILTSDTDEMQISHFTTELRRQLKTLESNGVTIRESVNTEEWAYFSILYNEAMHIKHAPENYYYSSSYFIALKENSDFEARLLIAEFEGKMIAGSIFISCGSIMQYHLGAVHPEYRHLSPLKLLINEARKIATKNKISTLHLGGGYNGEEDGLFQFKSRFSHEFNTFCVWRWIANPEIYQHLSQGLPDGRFPQYRNI